MVKFEFLGKELYIDGYLAEALLTLVYNIKKDWDFVILITGDRTVRVGKSVLAMTICAFLSYAINKLKLSERVYGFEDIFFNDSDMLDKIMKKPKYSINHYDEARETLTKSQWASNVQKTLISFFTECGQLNHIFVLVAPDFFDLKEDLAVARSEYLINVYRQEDKKLIDVFKDGKKHHIVNFRRGQFEFFNRKTKETLYFMAQSRRQKRYNLVRANFVGRFTNQYPLDEVEYRQRKKESLARFRERQKEREQAKRTSRSDVIRNKVIWDMHKENMKSDEISMLLKVKYGYELGARRVREIIKQIRDREAIGATGYV